MTSLDVSRHSSRERLLAAGKARFAKSGYEQTSTAAITRAAATSESQLIRNFGSKAGLLEALFNESWERLNRRVEQLLSTGASAREATASVLTAIMGALAEDHDLAFLLLFEGRRLRGKHAEIVLSDGFQEFIESLYRLLKRGQRDGSFSRELDPAALGSALIGAVEGMVRDRIMSERRNESEPYSEAAIRAVFEALLAGLAPKR